MVQSLKLGLSNSITSSLPRLRKREDFQPIEVPIYVLFIVKRIEISSSLRLDVSMNADLVTLLVQSLPIAGGTEGTLYQYPLANGLLIVQNTQSS